jgi:hypothetical protein
MKFWEAMKALEEGKKVRASHYAKGAYIFRAGRDVWTSWGSCLPSTFGISAFETEWELYEEPGYDFEWALSQVKAGKRVARNAYPGLVYSKTDNATVSLSDMAATDWRLA